jgi:hypothetical protein
MKKTPALKPRKVQEMASEYRLDYKKAKPNRFAKKMKNEPVIVLLDDDVAKIFKTPEDVNKALRALISAMPKEKVIEK